MKRFIRSCKSELKIIFAKLLIDGLYQYTGEKWNKGQY